MTNREFLNAVINGTVGENEIAFANAEIAKLDARNDKRRNTLSKEQEANLAIKDKILEALAEKPLVASAIATAVGISTQKASALCLQLVNDHLLVVRDIKVKGKGSVKEYALVD
jgi:hypothetical protein